MQTTYMDRRNTNEQVVEIANTEIKKAANELNMERKRKRKIIVIKIQTFTAYLDDKV